MNSIPQDIPQFECYFCKKFENGYGNSPAPFFPQHKKVCSSCNQIVIIARIKYVEGCEMPQNDPDTLLHQYRTAFVREIIPQERSKQNTQN